MPEICFPRLPEARVQAWAPGTAGRYTEMKFPIERRQQQWAGAGAPSGLDPGTAAAGASSAALRASQGRPCEVRDAAALRSSPQQSVTDVGVRHLDLRLNVWPSESYLIYVIFFSASIKVGCFFVYSSELWMVIKQVCKANIMYSKYFLLAFFMLHITCNVRPTVWHVSVLRTCVSW